MKQQGQVAASQEEQLFHIAFSQRRKINLEQLKQHMNVRAASLKQRTRIYRTLQVLFKEKIEYTKQFIKDFIKYFEDTLSLYSSFYKSIVKLDLSKKPKEQFVYEAFERAALELTQLNNGEVENLKVLTTWIQKILIPALNAVLDLYRDWTKQSKKQMESFDEEFESTRLKDLKFYDKITDNNDLLENEIVLVDKLEYSDSLLVKWGKHIFSAWIDLLKKEGEIREQLQKNIIEFHDKFTRVYNESQSSKNLLKFWMEMDSAPSWVATFSSVLNEKDLQFITYGCKTHHLKNAFQPFIDLTHEKTRIGDPFKLIQILQNKRFKCKLQKSQRDYINIKVYFTVDENVLLFDQAKKKVVMKLKENGFKVRRISQNLIELSGVEVGMVFDSNRKENVHFSTMDEAEQFVFFVENLMKESNPK